MHFPKPSGDSFEMCPEGSHFATCYRVIDLGTQSSTFNGEKKFSRKLMIAWEVHGTAMSDGRPFMVAKRYTLSTHKKANLRKDLEAWRGAPFRDEDLGPEGKFRFPDLLGKTCLVQVMHDETGEYANVVSIMAKPKGSAHIPATNPLLALSLNKGDFVQMSYDALSDGLKETIAKSPEYQELIRPKAQNGHNTYEDAKGGNYDKQLEDEIPF